MNVETGEVEKWRSDEEQAGLFVAGGGTGEWEKEGAGGGSAFDMASMGWDTGRRDGFDAAETLWTWCLYILPPTELERAVLHPQGRGCPFCLVLQQLLWCTAGLPAIPILLLPSPADFLQSQENANTLLNCLTLTCPNPSLTHPPYSVCVSQLQNK